MRRSHRLIPAPLDWLEGRVVPSHATVTAAVGAPAQRPASAPAAGSLATAINQEFDAFRSDYGQARATYFTSIQDQPAPSAATTYAFVAYTTQRVSLLAQQILSLAHPAGHGAGRPEGLKHLVTLKIMGPRAQMPPGSLARSLLDTIPQAGTSAPTASLYTLRQDDAIESARVAILNGETGS